MLGRREVVIKIAASAGTGLSGQKSDECETYPLAKTEWLQKLLLGVLKGGMNGVNCGNRQEHTSGLQIGEYRKSTPLIA